MKNMEVCPRCHASKRSRIPFMKLCDGCLKIMQDLVAQELPLETGIVRRDFVCPEELLGETGKG
jgi:hypothetical protein